MPPLRRPTSLINSAPALSSGSFLPVFVYISTLARAHTHAHTYTYTYIHIYTYIYTHKPHTLYRSAAVIRGRVLYVQAAECYAARVQRKLCQQGINSEKSSLWWFYILNELGHRHLRILLRKKKRLLRNNKASLWWFLLTKCTMGLNLCPALLALVLNVLRHWH